MNNQDRRDFRNRNNDNNSNQRRRDRFRRRRRRDFFRRQRDEKKDYPLCPLCNREITELSNAIAYKESGSPAHFDCIMKTIQTTEAISPNERICYLGKGSFGIVRFQKIGGSIPFVIRKRIQYESLEQVPAWRKALDQCGTREKKNISPPQVNPPPQQ